MQKVSCNCNYCVPLQLEEINWRLNLQLAQSTQSKMKLPNAMFELGVRDENSGVRVITVLM